MALFSKDDWLDEQPIDTSFFTNNPVLAESDQEDCGEIENPRKDEDPLGTATSSKPVMTTVQIQARKLVYIKTPHGPVPVISLPTPKDTTTPKRNAKVPPEYAHMSFEVFSEEMCQNINNVVMECVGLFGRDPLEYHPFYLRVYKFLAIGQRLGYLSTEVTEENRLWTEFSNFAVSQFKISKGKIKCYTGEMSPYAVYLLTKKVVIGGKEIKQITTEKERKRKLKNLETAARNARRKWEMKAGKGTGIRNDLQARLAFLKLCVVMTNPADTIRMNNLWSKFLSKEGFTNGNVKVGGWEKMVSRVPYTTAQTDKTSDDREPPAKRVKYAENISDQTGSLEETCQRNEDDDGLSKPLVIKVIVKPSSSSPVYSPSPPVSPCPVSPEEPTSPSVPVTEKLDLTPSSPEKKGDLNSMNLPMSKKLKTSVQKRNGILTKRVVKQVLKSKNLMGKPSGKLGNVSSNLLKRKKLRLINLCANSAESTSALKQIQLEKLISQRKARLPGIRGKKIGAEKTSGAEAPSSKKPEPRKPFPKEDDEQNSKRVSIISANQESNQHTQNSSIPDAEMEVNSNMTSTDKGPVSMSSSLNSLKGKLCATEMGPGLEKCDQCNQWCHPSYMAIHREAAHNPERQLKCPVCSKMLSNPHMVWNHICSLHLADFHLESLDPALLLPPVPAPPVPIQPYSSKRGRRQEPGAPSSTAAVTCEFCGKVVSARAALDRHIRLIHNEDQTSNCFQCPYCPKQYRGRDWLDFHIKKDHEGSLHVRCPECKRDLHAPGKLWRHMIDRHGNSPLEAAAIAKVTITQCVYCGQELLAGRQLHKHVRSEHPDNLEEFLAAEKLQKSQTIRRRSSKPGQAKKINYVKKSSKEQKREQRRRMREEGIGPAWLQREQASKRGRVHPEFQVKCPVEGCKAVTSQGKYMKFHLRIYHATLLDQRIVERKIVRVLEKTKGHLVLQCKLCNQYLFTFEEMKAHLVSLHTKVFDGLGKGKQKDVTTKCPHCEQMFASVQETCDHVEASHPQLCWRCPECNKVVLDSKDLGKHFEEDHENYEKETEEESKFLDMSTIKEIVWKPNISTSDRYAKDRLAIRKIKTKCEICKQQVTMDNLATHIKVIHGVKENISLACSICNDNKQFKSRATLLVHVKNAHESEWDNKSLEIIEIASKINTEANWRDMKVKNPNGWKRTGRKLKPLKKRSQKVRKKPASSTDKDGEDSDNDNDNEATEVQAKRRVPQRSCVKLRARKDIEKFKRLVISLVRLTDEELSRYIKK